MLPQHRAHSTLLRCSNFSTLILGIIMVHDTKKWISICFHGVGSFLHFHSIGTSPLFFEESLWRLIPNNGSALYFTLPRCKTLFTLLQCGNFSSPVLGIVVVVDPKERISSIFQLPHNRTLYTLSLCRNFPTLVLGIILVLDTQQWINTFFYAFMVQDLSIHP